MTDERHESPLPLAEELRHRGDVIDADKLIGDLTAELMRHAQGPLGPGHNDYPHQVMRIVTAAIRPLAEPLGNSEQLPKGVELFEELVVAATLAESDLRAADDRSMGGLSDVLDKIEKARS